MRIIEEFKKKSIRITIFKTELQYAIKYEGVSSEIWHRYNKFDLPEGLTDLKNGLTLDYIKQLEAKMVELDSLRMQLVHHIGDTFDEFEKII